MAEFINTIDALGDDAVTDSIIQKTIVEFKCNVLDTVGNYAFQKCKNLVNVEMPIAKSIGNSGFDGCNALGSVYFPTVTSIGTYAFRGCSALLRADFPSLTEIGQYVFHYCSNLEKLILRKEAVCTLGTAVFSNSAIANGIGYVYVPKSLVAAYKEATNWSAVADQIRAIEDYPEITGG